MTEELEAQVEENVEQQVVEQPAEVVEQKPDPNDLRGLIEHAQKEVEARARDEQGRFVKGEGEKPKNEAQAAKGAAQEQTQSPVGAQVGTEVKPLEAPATWKAGAKGKWATIDPEVQAEIWRREKDLDRNLASNNSEFKQAKAFADAFEPVLGPHRQYLMQAGSVEMGIKNLLETSAYAAKDPAGFIQWFAQQKGIDLGTMQQHEPQGESNPEVAHLKQVIQGLQGTVQQLVGDTQQQKTRTVASEIQAYADEKDASGNTLRPHFESVRSDIFELIPILKNRNPDWSVRQILDAAYQRAIRINDDVYSQIEREKADKAKIEREAKERAEKARLSKKSLTGGSPVGETRPKSSAKDRSVRDDILAAMEEHGVESRL